MPEKLPNVELPRTTRGPSRHCTRGQSLGAVAGRRRPRSHPALHTDDLTLIGTLPFPERIPHVLKSAATVNCAACGRRTGSGRRKAVLFDVATGQRLTEIGDEYDSVLAADISPNQKWVALGGPARLVKIFSTETGELKRQIKKHTDWVTAIEFSPNGECSPAEIATAAFMSGSPKPAASSSRWEIIRR